MIVQHIYRGIKASFEAFLAFINRKTKNLLADELWFIFNAETGDVDAVEQTLEESDRDEESYGRLISYDGIYYLADMMALTTKYFPVSSTMAAVQNPYIDSAEGLLDLIKSRRERFVQEIRSLRARGSEFGVDYVMLISNLTSSEIMGLSVSDNRLMYIRNYKDYGNLHEVYDMRLIDIEGFENYNIADKVTVVPPSDEFIELFALDLGLSPCTWSTFGGNDIWQPRTPFESKELVVDYITEHGDADGAQVYENVIKRLNQNCVVDMHEPEFYAFLEYRFNRLEHFAAIKIPWVLFEKHALAPLRKMISA